MRDELDLEALSILGLSHIGGNVAFIEEDYTVQTEGLQYTTFVAFCSCAHVQDRLTAVHDCFILDYDLGSVAPSELEGDLNENNEHQDGEEDNGEEKYEEHANSDVECDGDGKSMQSKARQGENDQIEDGPSEEENYDEKQEHEDGTGLAIKEHGNNDSESHVAEGIDQLDVDELTMALSKLQLNTRGK